jgi:hypothetical protein
MPPDEMVQASEAAIQDFSTRIFPTLTPEEKQGIKKLAIWFKAVYLKAGYKLICRWIVNTLVKDL